MLEDKLESGWWSALQPVAAVHAVESNTGGVNDRDKCGDVGGDIAHRRQETVSTFTLLEERHSSGYSF
jgi:hypothetical protein